MGDSASKHYSLLPSVASSTGYVTDMPMGRVEAGGLRNLPQPH